MLFRSRGRFVILVFKRQGVLRFIEHGGVKVNVYVLFRFLYILQQQVQQGAFASKDVVKGGCKIFGFS